MKLKNQAPRIYALASGKGGVGKSNLAANLAVALSNLGQRVLLYDADLSLANADLLFGLTPHATLRDVVEGKLSLREIVVPGPAGISIVPAGSGVAALADLPPEKLTALGADLAELACSYDLVLIDVPSGIGGAARRFTALADEKLIVLTPEPTSVTDAYAVVKLMRKQDPHARIRLVVNMAKDAAEAERITQAFGEITARFLGCRIESLGALLWDASVPDAVRRQQPFLLCYPNSLAARTLRSMSHALTQPGETHGLRAAQAGSAQARFQTWFDSQESA